MNAPRRLLAALALATALLVPAAAAQAAPPGVNVSAPQQQRRPVRQAPATRRGGTADVADLEQSGAKTIRSFVQLELLTGGTRDVRDHQVHAVRRQGAGPRHARPAHRHRRPRHAWPRRRSTPPSAPTSRPSSGAAASPTRSGTRPDEHDLLAQRPAARRLRGAAQGRLPGDQGRRPRRDGARRRPRRQRLRVRRGALRQRRQGLLRRRRRPHRHRLPDHRPARVLPRAERAHRALLLHGLPRGPRDDARPRRRQADLDDRARLGDDDGDLRARRPRRHQGRPASRQAEQADFLDEGLRLPGQRPVRRAGRLVQPRTTSRRARPTTRSTSA